MLTTTHKNHSKMVEFLNKYSPRLNSDVKTEGLLSGIEVYWDDIKRNTLKSMNDIYNSFMPDLETMIEHENLSNEDILKIISFEIKYNLKIYNQETINGLNFIGDLSCNLERVARKLQNNIITTINGEAYYYDSDSDYETAIEIVTYHIYRIPLYRCFKLDENTIFIFEDKNICKTYSTKSSNFVGYGTHWM